MTPSHMTSLGDVMSVEKRLALLKECAVHDRLIIEDDYDNEFRYFSKPIPCLQGLAGGENVVYLSTFSKLLLPSIRLSFMILPDSLLPLYEKKRRSTTRPHPSRNSSPCASSCATDTWKARSGS